jgi:hypothetical protein
VNIWRQELTPLTANTESADSFEATPSSSIRIPSALGQLSKRELLSGKPRMQSGRQQGTRKRKMRRQPQPKKPLALDDLPPPAPIDEQRFGARPEKLLPVQPKDSRRSSSAADDAGNSLHCSEA